MITSRKRRSNFSLTNQTDRVGKKDKSRFGIDTFILVPAGALIAGAKLSECISPEIFPFLAFCGLVFPAALLMFGLGVVLRLFRRDWKGMICPVLFMCFMSAMFRRTAFSHWYTAEGMDESRKHLERSCFRTSTIPGCNRR